MKNNTSNMQTFKPKISIIIPVYNGANYLKEAIDSALNQTYDNFEVIVINDGSVDNGETEKIAKSYGSRIRYIAKENGGVSSALNCGIRNMEGEYFSWLSHDDKYEKNKLKDSVNYLATFNNRENCIVMCGAKYINSKSENTGYANYHFLPNRIYSGEEMIKYLLKNGTINGCCMLIPKSAFNECGMFDERLRYNQDALMWYKMFINKYRLVADVSQKNVMYRIHINQTSKTRMDLLRHDSILLTRELIFDLIKMSSADNNYIFLFAKRQAKANCIAATYIALQEGKMEGLISCKHYLAIIFCCIYGWCKRFLKTVYKSVFLTKKI